MKRIGIYFFCIILIGCITSGALYFEKEKAGKIAVERSTHPQETEMEEDTEESVLTITNSTEQLEKPKFYLQVEETYLVIYESETGKFYDRTSIRTDELPVQLQNRLKEGFYFWNEKELYEFLENYSS